MITRKSLLGGVAAIAMASFGFATPAAAADWSSSYIGAHVSYGDASLSGSWCPSECELPFAAFDLNGGLGGVQAGFNMQYDNIVVGAEADLSFTSWSDTAYNCGGGCTSSATASIDMLASIRARAGMTFDETLVYVTGGLAIADGDFEGSCSDFCGKESIGGLGGVIGGGVEMAMAEHVSIRGEGLYYFFSDDNSLENWEAFSTGDKVGIDDAWVVRLGMNYRF